MSRLNVWDTCHASALGVEQKSMLEVVADTILPSASVLDKSSHCLANNQLSRHMS